LFFTVYIIKPVFVKGENGQGDGSCGRYLKTAKGTVLVALFDKGDGSCGHFLNVLNKAKRTVPLAPLGAVLLTRSPR
jgi:hypothetical protein